MQIRRALIITFLNSNANTAAMFIVALFLARLLTPAQVGAFSLGVVLINLASVFRDLGAQTYITQKQNLTAADVASAMGMMLFMAAIISGVMFFCAPLAAQYFEQPEVASVVRVLLISFMIVPVTGLLSALLMRGLQAGKSAIVHSASTVAFCVIALLLATSGAGAISMAWANVANVAVNLVGFWYFRQRGYLILPSFSGWAPIFKYGGGVVANHLANVANQSAPDVAIGRILGGHSVGVYSRANGLVSLYQQAVAPMLNYNVLPYVAHGGQSREVLSFQLARAGAYLSVTSWPVYIFLATFAPPVILLLYGPQWSEAYPLVVLLCLAGAIKSPFLHLSLALQAVDRSWAAAWPSITAFLTRALAVLVIRPDSLGDLTWCMVAGDVAGTVVIVFLARKNLKIDFSSQVRHLTPSVLVGTGFLACALMLAHVATSWGLLSTLLLAVPALTICWLVLVFLTCHPIRVEVIALASRLRSSSKTEERS